MRNLHYRAVCGNDIPVGMVLETVTYELGSPQSVELYALLEGAIDIQIYPTMDIHFNDVETHDLVNYGLFDLRFRKNEDDVRVTEFNYHNRTVVVGEVTFRPLNRSVTVDLTEPSKPDDSNPLFSIDELEMPADLTRSSIRGCVEAQQILDRLRVDRLKVSIPEELPEEVDVPELESESPLRTMESILAAYRISGLHAPLHEAGLQDLPPKGDMFILDMNDPWDLRYVRTVQSFRRMYADVVNVTTYVETIRLFSIIQ